MPAECHSADERQPELTTKKIYMISILFPLFLDGIWFSGGSGMKRALKSPNRTTQNLFWERVALMTAKQQKNRERIMISWLDFWRRITSSGTTLFWKAQSHAHVRCEQCIKSKSIIIIVAFSLRYEFLNRCRTTLKISEHLLSPVLACTQRTTTRSYTAGRDRFPFFFYWFDVQISIFIRFAVICAAAAAIPIALHAVGGATMQTPFEWRDRASERQKNEKEQNAHSSSLIDRFAFIIKEFLALIQFS